MNHTNIYYQGIGPIASVAVVGTQSGIEDRYLLMDITRYLVEEINQYIRCIYEDSLSHYEEVNAMFHNIGLFETAYESVAQSILDEQPESEVVLPPWVDYALLLSTITPIGNLLMEEMRIFLKQFSHGDTDMDHHCPEIVITHETILITLN